MIEESIAWERAQEEERRRAEEYLAAEEAENAQAFMAYYEEQEEQASSEWSSEPTLLDDDDDDDLHSPNIDCPCCRCVSIASGRPLCVCFTCMARRNPDLFPEPQSPSEESSFSDWLARNMDEARQQALWQRGEALLARLDAGDSL